MQPIAQLKLNHVSIFLTGMPELQATHTCVHDTKKTCNIPFFSLISLISSASSLIIDSSFRSRVFNSASPEPAIIGVAENPLRGTYVDVVATIGPDCSEK
jgi:hypothetical protein